MEKADDIVHNTAPSLAGVAAESADKDVEDDLDNNLTATKNIEDNDVVGASPPSTTPTKPRHLSYSKRRSQTSPSALSPFKGKAIKKARESAKHTTNRRRSKSTRGALNPLNKNTLNKNKKTHPPSSRSSPTKGPSSRTTRSTEQKKRTDGLKITNKVIVQRFRSDTFAGRTIAAENVYDDNDIAAHDLPFMDATLSKFGHHKMKLSEVKDGYLTNDLSLLSRLLLEDMLTQYNDNDDTISFRVLVSKPSNTISEDDKYLFNMQCLASKIYWHQSRCDEELGIHSREIMGTKYHELYATLVPNDNHKSIKEGKLTMSEIEALLDGEGGFDLRFEGTASLSVDGQSDIIMKIKWRDMVEFPSSIMIFGPRSHSIRSFNSLFKDKPKVDYIHHIHRQIAQEVRGDTEQSLALIAAYQTKRLIVSTEDEKISSEKSEKSLMLSMNFLGDEQSAFFKRVDDTFKGAIETSLANYQNYKDPIVSNDKMIEFMEEAQQLFPSIWKALANMRGINADWSRGNHLVVSKQMQVFYQLMSQARQADPRRLVHWAFVESLASYGHGIGKKPQNLSSYWGYTTSTTTRDDMMKGLGKDLQQRTTEALRKQKSSLLCFDNIQRGEPRLYQRGEKSSFYVSGTHQVANEVVEYDDRTWDDSYVEMTYDQRQAIPSPSNFPAFEDIDQTSVNELIGVFTNFDSIECKAAPDMSGERVKAYKFLLRIRYILLEAKRCFSVNNVCQNSNIFDDNKIDTMRNIVRSSYSKPILTGAAQLQEKTVKCWNPTVGNVTSSLMLGVMGLDEESAMQCGAITLDQLYRVGLLDENEDGTWRLADGWEKRRVMLYGDCKTIENIAKFSRDIANRPLSYDDINNQVEVIMDVLTRVQLNPGDWHSGSAMLKAIFTLFYDGMLKPFQEALGWKRINKDVAGCYFQACRLVDYVASELMRAFMYEYASTHAAFNCDDCSEDDHATFLCEYAIGFETFLRDMRTSEDEVRRAFALFLEMHSKFRNFVDSYRCGDSIAILLGYNGYVPYWQMLGQLKYVERVWAQNEQQFLFFPFSRFMESIINRCVRIRPAESGSRMVAQDEYLELMNALLVALPMPRKLESFIRQGQYIGLIGRAKEFVAEQCAIASNMSVSKNVESTMIPEKQLIFEMIMKLKVNSPDNCRKYKSKEVYQVVGKLSTDLKRAKDTRNASCSEDYSYNRLYSSINQMMSTERRDMNENTANNEEEDDENDYDEIDEDIIMASAQRVDEDEEVEAAEQDDSPDRLWMKQHTDMLVDLEAAGWQKINKMNLKQVRQSAFDRAKRHRQVNKEIAASVKERRSGKIGKIGTEDTQNVSSELAQWRQQCDNYLRNLRGKSGKTDVLANNIP